MDAVRIQTALNVTVAYQAAGLPARLLAWLADTLFMAAYLFLCFTVLESVGVFEAGVGLVFSLFLMILPFFGYHLLFELFYNGQSLGKKLVGIKVVRLDGSAPTLGNYLLRWLFRLVDILLSNGLVAVLSIALTQRGQRLGDLAAGTVVVRQRQRVQLADTIYAHLAERHPIRFPQAEHLSDADVQTIQEVLNKLRTEGRNAQTIALARKAKAAVEKKLGTGPVETDPEAFLRQVVRDFNAVLDAYVVDEAPRPA